mgnify:CR=1 FL=1
MAQVKLYNVEGKENGTVELNDAVFGVKANQELVHQVYIALRANARQPWAHAKDRSDVAGGGRKPWRQKGTGRARHGSIRSPLWRSGGATFGPLKTRSYKQKVNKKMNKQAVRMCLSDKATEAKLFVIDELKTEGKTKALDALKNALGVNRTALILTAGTDEKTMQTAAHIEKTDVARAEDVNVVDLLHHQFVIATKDAVGALEKRLA